LARYATFFGFIERRTHDYARHGITSLFAAYSSLLTGLTAATSVPNAVPAKGVEEPEQVAYPKRHDDDHHDIQYGLDRRLHGNEAVDQPKQHTYGDECENDIDKWQGILLLSD
jgi:hypothetical protein